MKVIEYTNYEMNDLIRTLEYAKDKKMKDYKDGKMNLSQYQYEIGIINDLIAKVPLKTFNNSNKKTNKNTQILKIM